MPTLNFSLISDDAARIEAISGIIRDFTRKSNQNVQSQILSWKDAWQQILDFSLRGDAPDVSHIGSTWSSTLSAMNALRPFTQVEIDDFGGIDAFFQTVWASTHTSIDPTIWAIPWSTFTFILVYRRDLIAKAGVDEAKAFDTAKDMANTFAALQAVGVKNPWAIETSSTWDLIHIAASWVWGAGGNYMSADGTKVLVHTPKTLAGLSDFFDLVRYLSPQTRFLSAQQCLDLFRQGQCAATVIAADNVRSLLDSEYSTPEVRSNLGTAALPGSPWVGGDNLVIWKNTRASQRQTQAALELVRYLSSKDTQINLYNSTGILPTRVDAFNQLSLDPPGLKPTLARVFNRGQVHPANKLWGRVETDLREAFEVVLGDLLDDSSLDVRTVLDKYLLPLGRRLERILG